MSFKETTFSTNERTIVFLRLIEYYEDERGLESNYLVASANRKTGVIFLTTNRLGEFDPAFESRIPFKLFYDALTPEQRKYI